MSHLRVAEPGEKAPEPEKKLTVTKAVEGSSRDVLVAMRRTLAKKIDNGDVSSNSLASVSKELREIDRLIRVFDAQSEESDDDRADDVFDASAI